MSIPPDRHPPADPQPGERLTDEDPGPGDAAIPRPQRNRNARIAALVVGAIIVLFLLVLVIAPLF